MKIFRKKGLKSKARAQVVTVVILTMAALLIIFNIVFRERAIKEQAVHESDNLRNMEEYLTSYFEEIDAIAKNLNYNYSLQNYLEALSEQDYRYGEQYVDIHSYEMSTQIFNDTLLSRQDVVSIMFFDMDRVLLHRSIYSYHNVIVDYEALDWYARAVENPSEAVITGPNQHAFFDTDDEILSLSRAIENSKNGEICGVVLIDLNLNKINEICSSFQKNQGNFLCILNSDGELVYEQQEGRQEYGLDVEENLKSLNNCLNTEQGDYFHMELGNEEYFVCHKTMENTEWILVDMLPYSGISAELWNTSLVVTLSGGATLILILILLNRILNGVVEPVERLQHHMEKVSIENLNQKVNIDSDDEIGKLAINFNDMLDRIENLKEQVVQEQEDKRKYELQVLQAQINPHFLYNTLDSIIWMAETNDPHVVAMTEALAKLFRISLNKGNEEILLRKEIEHVENYLIIQSMRYADKFTYEIHVDPETENLHIIKLILQPVVENCIYHGIKKKKGAGHIIIQAFLEDDLLKIKISDDGCGMSPEMCRKILSNEAEPENISGSGIGISNVNERIQLRFGKEYGIVYESEEGKGTTVTYRLPVCREESTDAKKQ